MRAHCPHTDHTRPNLFKPLLPHPTHPPPYTHPPARLHAAGVVERPEHHHRHPPGVQGGEPARVQEVVRQPQLQAAGVVVVAGVVRVVRVGLTGGCRLLRGRVEAGPEAVTAAFGPVLPPPLLGVRVESGVAAASS